MILVQSLADYLTVNDNLHVALKKYDQLSARVAASNQEDDHENRQYSSGQRSSTTHRSSLSSSNQAVEDDDDPFAEFVRARAGSAYAVSTKENRSAASPATQNEISNQDDEDDPFASFVQQRAAKILGSAEKETKKPAAAPKVEKNLIDLWDDDGAYVCVRGGCGIEWIRNAENAAGRC